MPSPESSQYKSYFDQLIEAVGNGSMVWEDANPTTFVWESKPPAAKLSIQRLERTQAIGVVKRIVTYLFQAYEVRSGQQVQRVSLNGAEDPDLNGQLENLFGAIKSEISRKRLEFLKSILPPMKNG